MWRLSAALCLIAAHVSAQDMRPQEERRLADFHATAGAAILQAMAGGRRGDVDLLQEVLAGAPLDPLQTTLPGTWNCRVLKLGGAVPLVAYANFKCEIAPDGDGFTLQKQSGSQLTKGRIALRDGQMIYLGVGYVAETEPPAYAALTPAVTGNGAFQPEVGLVEQPDPDRVRILFPAPILESDFDILYLTR